MNISQQMHKGLLLYMGYHGYCGTRYYDPTDEELKLLLAATNEILLIPLVVYNRYDDAEGNTRQVITHEIIENMTPDMVGDPNRYATIKSEYFASAEKIMDANYHIEDFVSDSVYFARRLVALKPDVRLWFSVPSSECLHALTHLYTEEWITIVHRLKAVIEPEIWENNVQGIYYSGEDVVTAGYTKFDPERPKEDFCNPIVYSMRKVSEAVHAYGKSMLWIPYYDSAASSCINLGHVVNRTDIFDTVILQPSYYFHDFRFPNVEIVRDCVAGQRIVDPNGNVVGGEKCSDTVIGFEMEIDWEYFEKEGYPERYRTYEETFGDFVGTYPTAYYAGCPDTAVRLHDLIGTFFKRNG